MGGAIVTPAERLCLAFPRLTLDQAEHVASLRPEGTPTPGPLAVALRLTGAVQGVYRPRAVMVAGEEALCMSAAAAQAARSDTLCLANVTHRHMQEALDALHRGDIGTARRCISRLDSIMEQVIK